MGGRNQSYGIALLDISDPAHPRYAAVREMDKLLPGSVGKLCIATGFMGALRKTYPDPAARENFLRSTIRTADAFVNSDGKTVALLRRGLASNRESPYQHRRQVLSLGVAGPHA